MRFKYGLKTQKLLAQGNALGHYGRKLVALKGQKLQSTRQFIRLLPLQGALLTATIPRATPWVIMDANLSPCKGKSFKERGNL